MDKTPSIMDVAQHAGVSASTVSLVMNNRPNVAAETAQAVWRSVKALGYRPGGASGRKRGPKPGPRRPVRVPRLLLLHTGYLPAYFRCDVVSAFHHGVQTAIDPGGAELILCHASEAAAVELLRRSRTDGVLLTGRVTDARLREALCRLPCVQALGVVPPDLLWDHVSHDCAAAARCACRWLAQRSRRHCVALHCENTFSGYTWQVLQQDVARGGGRLEAIGGADLLSFDGIFPQVNSGRLAALLAADPVPDGVFLGSDALAAPLYRLCHERGLLPGRDVDVVCSSLCGPTLGVLQPRPAVVNLHPEQVGQQAVGQVLWRIEHRNEPRQTRLIAPSLA